MTDYVDPNGTATVSSATDYTFDPISGNQASITTYLGSSDLGTVNYIYNEATGQLIETWTGTTHANATTDVAYGYNAQGQLTSVTQVKLNGAAASGTTTYTYDAAGNLLSESDPNGMTTVYVYDDLNRMLTETVMQSSTNLFSETYEYYDNGLRENETDTHYSGGSELSQIEYQWTYDNDGRLAEEALTILYNHTGNTEVPTAYTDDFSYDLDNNRVKETITGGTAGNGTIDYTYNGDDQRVTENGTYTTSSNNYTTDYTYDADGNLSTEVRTGNSATTNTYTYDLRNRMTGSTTNSTPTTYAYDANGVLISQTTGSTTTTYLNDPQNPTGYTKAIQTSTAVSGTTTSTCSYVLGLGVVAQADSSTGLAYLLIDGHGSTRALINTTGAVISGQIYDYDAFGTALDFNPSTAQTDWLANGDGFYDPSTGWTYHLARWRNGFWFTQEDSSLSFAPGDLANANLYVYIGGNPLNSWDPTGHDLVELEVSIGIDSTIESANAISTAVLGAEEGAGLSYLTSEYAGVIDQEIAITESEASGEVSTAEADEESALLNQTEENATGQAQTVENQELTQVEKNAIAGDAREAQAFEQLKQEYPDSEVLPERTLRDANGDKLIDPETGTGRRVDFAVVNNETGEVENITEVTSQTADKADQLAKTVRIRQLGDVFIRNPYTGELVQVPPDVTEDLLRLP